MIIKQIRSINTHSQQIEASSNTRLEKTDEAVVAQEGSTQKKALPDIFTLQAQAKSVQGKKAEKKPKPPINDPYSREQLQYQCGLIISSVNAKYGQGTAGSSALLQAMKRELTNYLQSVGTPTALQMLKEFYPE